MRGRVACSAISIWRRGAAFASAESDPGDSRCSACQAGRRFGDRLSAHQIGDLGPFHQLTLDADAMVMETIIDYINEQHSKCPVTS
jgi:hypothetical protein